MTGQEIAPYDAGSLVSILDRIGDAATLQIEAIPSMDDETLAALHESALQVEGQAWRVVVHVRAEMMGRARHRALENGQEIGVVVGKLAKELDVSSGDLYRDEKIHALFIGPGAPEEILGIGNLDKVYYQEAVVAPKPEVALRLMADQRDTRTHYNAGDARADVKALKDGASPQQILAAADREPIRETSTPIYALGEVEVAITDRAFRLAGLWDHEEIEVVARPGSITLRQFRKGSRR